MTFQTVVSGLPSPERDQPRLLARTLTCTDAGGAGTKIQLAKLGTELAHAAAKPCWHQVHGDASSSTLQSTKYKQLSLAGETGTRCLRNFFCAVLFFDTWSQRRPMALELQRCLTDRQTLPTRRQCGQTVLDVAHRSSLTATRCHTEVSFDSACSLVLRPRLVSACFACKREGL